MWIFDVILHEQVSADKKMMLVSDSFCLREINSCDFEVI